MLPSWPSPAYAQCAGYNTAWAGHVPQVRDVDAAMAAFARGQAPMPMPAQVLAGPTEVAQAPMPMVDKGTPVPVAGATPEMTQAFTEWIGRGMASAPPSLPVQAAAAQAQQQQGWNALLQYYAYYSFFLAAGSSAPPGPPPAVPPHTNPQPAFAGATPETLAQVRAWHEQNAHPQQNLGDVRAIEATRAVEANNLPPAMPAVPVNAPPRVSPDPRSSSDEAAPAPSAGEKRDRDGSDSDERSSGSGKMRKKRTSLELKVCVNCGVSRTPFWRKERSGVGSLCNACGLYLAKNDAPRPKMLWKRGNAETQQEK